MGAPASSGLLTDDLGTQSVSEDWYRLEKWGLERRPPKGTGHVGQRSVGNSGSRGPEQSPSYPEVTRAQSKGTDEKSGNRGYQ